MYKCYTFYTFACDEYAYNKVCNLYKNVNATIRTRLCLSLNVSSYVVVASIKSKLKHVTVIGLGKYLQYL